MAWELWQAELENPTPEDRRLDRPTDPALIEGFWRRLRGKTLHDDSIIINAGRWAKASWTSYRDIDPASEEWQNFLGKDWLHCVATTREDTTVAISTGFWPDGKAAKQMTRDEKMGIDTATGGNNPPVEESLADQIKNLAARIDETKEPATQAEADALTGKLDRMRRLLNLAEEERKKEKEPWLRGGQEVDNRWKAIGEPGGNAYRDGTNKQKAFLRKEQKRLDDLAEAERKRLREEADASAATANQQAEQMGMEPEREQAPEPVVEAKKARTSSSYGRAASLKKVKVAVIDDLPKLVNSLLFPGEGNPVDTETMAFFQEKADRALRGGITLPGVKVEEAMR